METLLILLHQCQSRLNESGIDAGVLLAGLFTLIGAALGALLGGRAAFKGTVKANNQALQRSKLEEAYSALDEVITIRANQMTTVRDMLRHCEAREVRQHAQQELRIHNHLPAANRLATLVKFYLCSADHQVFELTGIQFLFDRFVCDLDEKQGVEDQASNYASEQLNEFHRLAGNLKMEICQAHAKLS